MVVLAHEAPVAVLTFSLEDLIRDANDREARIVVVLAHPDDEVLGCGILLSRLSGAQVIHVTDGAPRNGDDAARLGFASPAHYAEARRAELEAAMALAGIGPDRLLCLDVADQGAPSALVTVTERLVPLLRGTEAVLTHAYEGGHPDHDATAFAVHAATRRLGSDAPALIEMPFYRASADDWLRQRFEPRLDAGRDIISTLTDAERALKRLMYEAHASQAGVLDHFPIEAERFRRAPDYDFEALPNGGLVLYERYGWGLTGGNWLAQAAAARRHLDGLSAL